MTKVSCGVRFLAILRKGHSRPDIRAMFDGMNEMTTLSYDYIERLHKVGIKAQASHQSSPSYQPITITETIGR